MSTQPEPAERRFGITDEWLIYEPSARTHHWLYLHLARLCGEQGWWYGSQAKLAEKFDVSVPTIKRALKALRRARAVSWQQRRSSEFGNGWAIYRIATLAPGDWVDWPADLRRRSHLTQHSGGASPPPAQKVTSDPTPRSDLTSPITESPITETSACAPTGEQLPHAGKSSLSAEAAKIENSKNDDDAAINSVPDRGHRRYAEQHGLDVDAELRAFRSKTPPGSPQDEARRFTGWLKQANRQKQRAAEQREEITSMRQQASRPEDLGRWRYVTQRCSACDEYLTIDTTTNQPVEPHDYPNCAATQRHDDHRPIQRRADENVSAQDGKMSA